MTGIWVRDVQTWIELVALRELENVRIFSIINDSTQNPGPSPFPGQQEIKLHELGMVIFVEDSIFLGIFEPCMLAPLSLKDCLCLQLPQPTFTKHWEVIGRQKNIAHTDFMHFANAQLSECDFLLFVTYSATNTKE